MFNIDRIYNKDHCRWDIIVQFKNDEQHLYSQITLTEKDMNLDNLIDAVEHLVNKVADKVH